MARPIGYWLKHLDRLIEAAAERTFAEQKLTRRHWQIMNVLRESPQEEAGLTEAIRPFWGPGAITLDEVTSDLTRRGWLTQHDTGRYALTPAGQAGHAAAEEKVHGIRSTFLTGLTGQDYRGTVRVLQRMAENLERATGSPACWPPSSTASDPAPIPACPMPTPPAACRPLSPKARVSDAQQAEDTA